MTIRLLADARGRLTKACLDRMLALAGGGIELALHFGDRDADYHAPSLHRLETRKGRSGHIVQDLRARGAHANLIAEPAFKALEEQAIEQFQRFAPEYRYRTHNLRNLQDYIDYYHILADAYAQQIEARGCTHAIFYCVPHLGYDTVLYQVAQAMGLKTLVLCQTIFPSRYFSMATVEDLGLFPTQGEPTERWQIEKGSMPELFYMDPRWQKASARGQTGWRVWAKMVKHLAVRDPASLLRPAYLADLVRRTKAVYGALPDWRDPFAKFFHVNELAYLEHLAEYESPAPDMAVPYIYVPLHNQPEMSTSALGGLFRDQLLMVEALAAKLPEGWSIYVKENPRQGSYARGPMFFHRLSRIAGVRFVPSDTSTQALMQNAKLVATVTGTVAWEAVRSGRPAVVFGRAWYRSLPGMHRWHQGVDLAQVAAARFEHAELERVAGLLRDRCHDGVIEQIYLKAVPDFDPAQNVEAVARTTLGLLQGAVPLTFPGAP